MLERLNKLSLPATILIASIVLGSFYFASQINKQNSIEKQQQIELQTKKDAGLILDRCLSDVNLTADTEMKAVIASAVEKHIPVDLQKISNDLSVWEKNEKDNCYKRFK